MFLLICNLVAAFFTIQYFLIFTSWVKKKKLIFHGQFVNVANAKLLWEFSRISLFEAIYILSALEG